jgi:hypothetical protein
MNLADQYQRAWALERGIDYKQNLARAEILDYYREVRAIAAFNDIGEGALDDLWLESGEPS